MQIVMGPRSRRKADQRIIHNHPFCAVCGSHMNLTVERAEEPSSHIVVSTVTGTIHESTGRRGRPHVVCSSCYASHGAWPGEVRRAVTGPDSH
jgi:hypothetical protein